MGVHLEVDQYEIGAQGQRQIGVDIGVMRSALVAGAESIIGGRFVGSVADRTEVAGIPAVIPTLEGRAWIHGKREALLDPTDPWPAGYKVTDTWPGDWTESDDSS